MNFFFGDFWPRVPARGQLPQGIPNGAAHEVRVAAGALALGADWMDGSAKIQIRAGQRGLAALRRHGSKAAPAGGRDCSWHHQGVGN